MQVLLDGGALALSPYNTLSSLEMSASAVYSMVQQNDSGSEFVSVNGRKEQSTLDTMDLTINIAKILLHAGRKEMKDKMKKDEKEKEKNEKEKANEKEEEKDYLTDLLKAVPSESDYCSVLTLGMMVQTRPKRNQTPKEEETPKVQIGNNNVDDVDDVDDAVDEGKGGNGVLSSPGDWLRKGQGEMKETNYLEAASSFYQAMVGYMNSTNEEEKAPKNENTNDEEDTNSTNGEVDNTSTDRREEGMALAQKLMNEAVLASRGLAPEETVSSSSGEDYNEGYDY